MAAVLKLFRHTTTVLALGAGLGSGPVAAFGEQATLDRAVARRAATALR